MYATDYQRIYFFALNNKLITKEGQLLDYEPKDFSSHNFFIPEVDGITYLGNYDLSKAEEIDLKPLSSLFDLTTLKFGTAEELESVYWPMCCCFPSKDYEYNTDDMKNHLIALKLLKNEKEEEN